MHIGFLLSSFHSESSGGGAESYVSTMADALIERGHRVTILALGATERTHENLRILTVAAPNVHWLLYRGLPVGKSLAMPVREIEWSRRGWSALMNLHRSDPMDVVETGETMVLQQLVPGLKPPLVVRGHGNPLGIKKFTGTVPTWGDRYGRKLQILGMRRAAAITAVSSFQAAEMADDLSISIEQVKVIPNPISPMLLRSALRQVPAQSSSPVILYTGRLELRKGTLELLASADHVTSTIPDAEYVLAGGRHNSIDDRTLQAALDANRNRDRVRLLGHVPWQKLSALYKRATVFVMPSYYETFGISVIEAMAFGLPVVAAKSGGLPEVVEDNITGLLVPPGDSRALAEAQVRLLRDPDLRARMGRAGRDKVLAEFTVDHVVPKALALYESAIRTRNEARTSQLLAKSCAS